MKRGINKSAAIRELLEHEPTLAPSEIQQRLRKDRGIKVAYSLISQVKYTGPKKDKASATPSRRPSGAITMDDLIAANAGAKRMGGVDVAKQALTMLEKLI